MSEKSRGTTVGLVDDLLRKPPNSFRDELVRNALAGVYHDFKSNEETPKVRLALELARYGYRDLARKAARGEYNDDPDEADHAAFARDIANDPKQAALWEKLEHCKTPAEAMAAVKEIYPEMSDEDVFRAAVECGFV